MVLKTPARLSDADELQLQYEALERFNANKADPRIQMITRLVVTNIALKQLDKEAGDSS